MIINDGIRLVSRPAKVGEYIVVINMGDLDVTYNRYCLGDILQVKDDYSKYENIGDTWRMRAVGYKNITHPRDNDIDYVIKNEHYLVIEMDIIGGLKVIDEMLKMGESFPIMFENRPAKVGEYVVVIGMGFFENRDSRYCIGDILKVTDSEYDNDGNWDDMWDGIAVGYRNISNPKTDDCEYIIRNEYYLTIVPKDGWFAWEDDEDVIPRDYNNDCGFDPEDNYTGLRSGTFRNCKDGKECKIEFTCNSDDCHKDIDEFLSEYSAKICPISTLSMLNTDGLCVEEKCAMWVKDRSVSGVSGANGLDSCSKRCGLIK